MVCDGYVKYEEAEADRSTIMQDFRDNEKKKILVWNLSRIILLHFFELHKYHKISQIQNGR